MSNHECLFSVPVTVQRSLHYISVLSSANNQPDLLLSPPFPEKVVKRLYLHPKYNVSAKVKEGVKEFYDYDVALVLLEEPLQISILARWELKIRRRLIQLTWAPILLIVCLFFHCVTNMICICNKHWFLKFASQNYHYSYFSGQFAYLAPGRQTRLWNYLQSPPASNKVMLLFDWPDETALELHKTTEKVPFLPFTACLCSLDIIGQFLLKNQIEPLNFLTKSHGLQKKTVRAKLGDNVSGLLHAPRAPFFPFWLRSGFNLRRIAYRGQSASATHYTQRASPLTDLRWQLPITSCAPAGLSPREII